MKTDAMQFCTGNNDIAPKRMDCTRSRYDTGEGAESVTAAESGLPRTLWRASAP